ncbi:MAG: SAM-dependent methyltransferase [Acidithiobacillus sp.]|nr:SAM-dependent methyltransferase [Acidithiobacillus sp.]
MVVSHPQRGHKEPLAAPDPLAQVHSERLCQRIAAAIAEAGGVLPFADYMHLALYAPGLGYYQAGQARLGPQGDFITAPEMGYLLGAVLARYLGPDPGADGILEFGAGSGALAAQIIGFRPELPYAVIETSPSLGESQRQRVPQLRQLARLPAAWQGVMLANEVLDALPVQVVEWTGTELQELGVRFAHGRFHWAPLPRPLDQRLQERLQPYACQWPHPYRTEVNLQAEAWLRTVAAALTRGQIILIDYGYPTRATYYHPQRSMGSLRAYYRHHCLDDPFFWPGLCDLTAHVDFESLLEESQRCGLLVRWFGTLARFLMEHGLLEIFAERAATADPRERLALANEVKRLTLPQEMGESFQVLVLERP